MYCFRRLAFPSAAFLLTLVACSNAPNDQALATDIKARLYSDAVTKPANVNVAVQGGIATLSGDVPSSDIALEAMKISKATPGIKGVKDQLTINGAPDTQQSAATAPPPSANASSTAPPPVNAPPPSGPGAYPPLPTATGSAAQPAPASTTPAESAQAPLPPPQPVSFTIPAGASVSVRMIDPIDSAHNTAGQVFRATLAEPLRSHGRVVVPRGAPVSVLLADARGAGRIKGHAELEVRLVSIEHHRRSYPVDSSIYEEQGKARGKETAVRTGIGAAAGAVIGAIAGGGKGAAIGSAAGGGAGFGVNVFTHGQQVKIPPESLLTFTLRRSLTIRS